MKKILALLTAMMLLVSACSSATVDGAGKELEGAITNVTDADNKYVQMVKGGYRSDDPDTTYEETFTAFFGAPRWKYFESDDGKDVVEFTGDCTYRDAPVKARIQFVVDEEGGTFEATYLAFNEVPQDAFTLFLWGYEAELSEKLDTDRAGVVAWAKEQVRIETERYKREEEARTVLIPIPRLYASLPQGTYYRCSP